MNWLGNWQLFNSTADLGERTNLGATHREIFKEMVSAGKSWSQSHVMPLWYDNKRAGQEWVTRGMPHYDQTFSLP